MKRMTTLWGIAVVLLAAGCRPADNAPDGPAVVSPPTASTAVAAPAVNAAGAGWQGFAGSRLGSTASQLLAHWKEPLQGTPTADGSCYYLRQVAAADQDVAFMIEGDHFVRYDVRSGERAAPGGGHIGMTLPELQALYAGSAQLQPHKYLEAGHDLRITAPAAGEGILNFEIGADGKATAWRVGLAPQVGYVEGCS